MPPSKSCATMNANGLLHFSRQTLFQPVLYFERAWSLFLLRQLGFDVWAALGETAPPVTPAMPPAGSVLATNPL